MKMRHVTWNSRSVQQHNMLEFTYNKMCSSPSHTCMTVHKSPYTVPCSVHSSFANCMRHSTLTHGRLSKLSNLFFLSLLMFQEDLALVVFTEIMIYYSKQLLFTITRDNSVYKSLFIPSSSSSSSLNKGICLYCGRLALGSDSYCR